MSQNPAQPLTLVDRIKQIADEGRVGGHFEGESKRRAHPDSDTQVVVDILKRGLNPYALDQKPGTYFMRVSLPCRTVSPMLGERVITRYEIDIDRYSTERELMEQAWKGGGLVAITQVEKHGETWDPEYVAAQAAEAMKELLAEISDPDKVRGA